MKKSSLSFIAVMMSLLLPGCNSNNQTDTVQNGSYVMEQEDVDEELLPRVIISDDEILFAFDLLSSYLPHGTYSIEDGILTMTTDDNKFSYVFKIDGDKLVFQKNESSTVHLIDNRFGVKITDNAEFQLEEE